jgi:LysM repeat protein
MIVSSFNNSSDGGTSSTQSAKEKQRDLGPQAKANRRKKRSTRGKLPQGTYIVKAGDTLGSIAETTGVPVTKLQELNPDLDQFSLEPGQKIKLK